MKLSVTFILFDISQSIDVCHLHGKNCHYEVDVRSVLHIGLIYAEHVFTV